MARSNNKRKAQAAWDRIEALGGVGVWESDFVIVSFADSGITDSDLAVFSDFPFIQTLDLSRTGIGDAALVHLASLPALKDLIVVDTKISAAALEAFRRAYPSITITTEPVPKGSINPFSGKVY